MTQRAVLSLLWPACQEALVGYVKASGATVLVARQFSSDALRQAVESVGGKVVVLEELLTTEDVSYIQHTARTKAEQAAGALHGQEALDPGVDVGAVTTWLEGNLPSYLERMLILSEALELAGSQYFVELTVLNEEWTEQGRFLLEWSKQRAIPVLHVTHGIGLARYYTVHSTLEADCYAVFGERGAENLLDEGVSADRIVAVGNPAWDVYPSFVARRKTLREGLCAKHGLDAALPIVVFGTTWNAYLSAFDQRSYVRDLEHALCAFARLKELGCAQAQMVVKDRFTHGEEVRLFRETLDKFTNLPGKVIHTMEEAKEWVVSADVLVSVDSNLAVECVLAGTPAVNIIDEMGLLLGPSFAADDGIVEVLPENLGDTVFDLLTDTRTRRKQQEIMRAKASYYNVSGDGQASARLAEVMRKTARPIPPDSNSTNGQYVWQTLLNATDTDATQYHNWPRSELVDLVIHPPRKVLDIGCAAGKTGEYIKQKYSQAKVYGVEQNRAAAELAAQRLDSVFAGKFEDFDFAAHGIGPGSLDTVVVADVLEHIYSPWDVLVRLKPYLTPDAQILASIPNTRNLALMKDLAEGHWRYEAWGLLDVTHIRFFTLKEIRRFFHETGYHVARVHHNLDGRLSAFYQQNIDKPLFNIDFDKFTLKNVNQEELMELCTIQFFVVAELGAVENKEFEAQETAREGMSETRTAYEQWRDARKLTRAQGDLYEQRMATWAATPVFHLAIITHADDGERLGISIQSLADQYYHHLRLTVVSVAAPPANWADSDKLAWRQVPESGLLEGAGRALLEGDSDWVGMIDAGDTVAHHSFLFLAEAANSHPAWRFIYTDEDVLTKEGKHEAPNFKPDFNLDLLRSNGYTGGLAVVSRPLFERLGGFAFAIPGAEDQDLALRVYEAEGAAAIGHIPDVLYHRRQGEGRWRRSATEIVEAGRRTVEAHLVRSGVAGTVEHGLFPASYRVRYQYQAKPQVSILVAMRDHVEAVQRCIESVLATTRYLDYEILIADNDSVTPAARAYLEGLKALGEERIRVCACPMAANLPLLHNTLAGAARGEYLLFLHFDAAVLHDDWLDSLMAHALRPEVGVVAPRLLGPDGAVEQTGLVLGLDRTADTLFRGEALDQAGYFGRALLEQDFSALGGGCLLVRKSLFTELGGFDAENFGTDFAETDLCRRAADRGLLAVWTPFVNVLCAGKAQRHSWRDAPNNEEAVRLAREAASDHLYRRWLPQLARDAAYNVNQSLVPGKYLTVETNATLTWDPLPWRPLPRILAHPADNQGCGEYRIISPMRALVDAGKVQGWADFHIFSPPEMERLDVDAIILQRQTEPAQIEAIARHKNYSRALRVYELDDLLINLPVKSVHVRHMPKDIAKKLRQAVALCDRFVVSTEPLKEAYRDLHADIRVVPNYLERARWGSFKPLRGQSARPRVGWAGGVGHTGDLEMISSVIKELSREVDWVFLGMCPEAIRPWVKEFHPGVPVEHYPAKLAGLNLDLALAPLEHNRFNEAKSHLRLLEYGILGCPVICSDIYPYQGDYPVTRVRNRHQDWVRAIRDHLADPEENRRRGDRLREYVDSHWMLEDNLDKWLQAWLP